MTERRTGSRSATALVALAGALGLAAGVAALYMTGGFAGNRAERVACTAADARVATLRPEARGEVAAFVVEPRPVAAPDLVFRDGDGRERRLSEFRGRTVLFNLWATWCAPCRHEMPALDRLQADLGGPAFEVVAVSIDLGSADKPREFYRETNIERLAFYQDTTGRVFQDLRVVGRAVGMPTTILVDPSGCIQGHLAGPAEWSSADAVRLIRAAMGG